MYEESKLHGKVLVAQGGGLVTGGVHQLEAERVGPRRG